MLHIFMHKVVYSKHFEYDEQSYGELHHVIYTSIGWRACSPACPSSAAFSADLSTRSAVGLLRSISRHHTSVSSSSRASGTTVFTRPMASACRPLSMGVA